MDESAGVGESRVVRDCCVGGSDYEWMSLQRLASLRCSATDELVGVFRSE